MLDKSEILEIIQNELTLTNNYEQRQNSLEESMSLYLGRPDGREIEGRSHVISTDIADAIEWIMPQIMKSFTQNNEIVVFDPVHEGDERQAELESEYVYEVLMKQNDGFIILHQFVKDALMQRNGILKVYYAEKNFTKVTDWTGITEHQLYTLLGKEGVELLEMEDYIDDVRTVEKNQQVQARLQQLASMANQVPYDQVEQYQAQIAQLQVELEKPVMLYNVKVSVSRIKGQIYVDPIPREEFRVNSRHNSINLDGARFTAHVASKTKSDTIEEFNLSMEEVNEYPQAQSTYQNEYRFTMMDESVFNEANESDDEAEELIEVSECYMRIDIDEVGISKLMKITVAGGREGTVTDLISVEEIDRMPWVTTTAFLMSHKFEGLSITDRLRQIQDQKTTLWRNMFDNMYLQNNQRNVVIDGQVNMDDLLVSRPGGVIRAKRLDAIQPLQTPQLGQDAYNMIEYLDRVRAGRTGVDPDGGATPQNIGDRVGSEGVDRLMNAKEELVGLIIRVIAETGVKPLCIKIRDLSINHVNAVVDFRFRGVWQQINPATWCDRTQCTVRVGTGTGDHQAQRAALVQVMEIQKQVASLPGQIIVDEQRTYNTIDDFCKFSGLNGANKYFIDPESPEGQQKALERDKQGKTESEKEAMLTQEMVKVQNKLADAETSKAEAQRQSVAMKAQNDFIKNQLQSQKQGYDATISALKQQLEEAKALAEDAQNSVKNKLERHRIDSQTALELTRIESDKQSQENENFKGNKESVQ